MTAEDLRYVNMSGKDKMNDKGKAKDLNSTENLF